jgi:hypothetical protein
MAISHADSISADAAIGLNVKTMDGLEQLFIGAAVILMVVSLAYLVTIVVIRRRSIREGLVDEAELQEVEFPQVLKPGSPDSYIPRGFEALGLSASATPEEIRVAFRRLALQVHPDHGGNSEDFMRLQEDFEHALSHAERHTLHAV